MDPMTTKSKRDKRGKRKSRRFTVGQNSHELRRKYWATRSSVCSFAQTAHSFACPTLLASLERSAALIRSLACLLTPELVGKWMIRYLKMSWFCPTVRLFATLFRVKSSRRPLKKGKRRQRAWSKRGKRSKQHKSFALLKKINFQEFKKKMIEAFV